MKIAVILVSLIVGLFVLVKGVNYYLSPSDTLTKADVIVAISGGDTKARTLEAVELYKQDLGPKILFSGAALDPLSPSNAEVMKNIALEAGVPEQDILIEKESKNTSQNASRAQGILDATKYKTIILVTSPYHQRRAYLEFKDKLDDEVIVLNHSSADKSWPSNWYLTPRGWWLGLSESVKTAATAAKNLK